MSPTASGIAMLAKVIADAELKKQQWLDRDSVMELDLRKMWTGVQNALDKEGMFDLCLASLQRATRASFGVLFFCVPSFWRRARSSALTSKAAARLEFGR